MQFHDVSLEEFITEMKAVHPGLDAKLLQKGFGFAMQAHSGQKRKSGRDYITHPANVAYILATLKSDTATVVAGLLHDVLEDTEVTGEQMVEHFGEEIASMVEAVTKIQQFTYHTRAHRAASQAENYRKLLMSVTHDVRVILVKLADRLHTMRTL
jgi:GTP pyrophosphokinase